jgi:hypothetical protein
MFFVYSTHTSLTSIMAPSLATLALLLLATARATPATPAAGFNLRPFTVDLGKHVPHMLDLVKHTHLPKEPEWPGVGGSLGIDLDVLKNLQGEWLHDFDWHKEQASMNECGIRRLPLV